MPFIPKRTLFEIPKNPTVKLLHRLTPDTALEEVCTVDRGMYLQTRAVRVIADRDEIEQHVLENRAERMYYLRFFFINGICSVSTQLYNLIAAHIECLRTNIAIGETVLEMYWRKIVRDNVQ